MTAFNPDDFDIADNKEIESQFARFTYSQDQNKRASSAGDILYKWYMETVQKKRKCGAQACRC